MTSKQDEPENDAPGFAWLVPGVLLLAAAIFVSLAPLTRAGLQRVFFHVSDWSAAGVPYTVGQMQQQCEELLPLLGVSTVQAQGPLPQTLVPPDRNLLIESVRTGTGPAQMLDPALQLAVQGRLRAADQAMKDNADSVDAESHWNAARSDAIAAYFDHANRIRGYLADWALSQGSAATKPQYAWAPVLHIKTSWYLSAAVLWTMAAMYGFVLLRPRRMSYALTAGGAFAHSTTEDDPGHALLRPSNPRAVQSSLAARGTIGRWREHRKSMGVLQMTKAHTEAETALLAAQAELALELKRKELELHKLQREIGDERIEAGATDLKQQRRIVELETDIARLQDEQAQMLHAQEKRKKELETPPAPKAPGPDELMARKREQLRKKASEKTNWHQAFAAEKAAIERDPKLSADEKLIHLDALQAAYEENIGQ